MKLLFKIAKLLVELLIFLFAGFLMLYITYYFGWSLLPGELQWGNDIPSALNNVYYLEQWYPPIPKWIHLWAGGMPFLALYPAAPFLLTFFIHKLFALSIYQVAKLVMFFSIPLAALGVVALGRVLTKNWLVGILAGIIMILSPDSWFWATIGGFYAMASSVPLYAWTIVFFSLAMQKKSFLLFVIASLLYGITWYFHPNAGVLAAVTMVILGLGFGFQAYGLKASWKGLLKSLAIIFIGFLLFAWWIFPFLTREEVGGIGISSQDMYRVSFKEILGLVKPVAAVYVTSTFFSANFIILFVLGVFFSLFRKGILRWAALACLIALFIMTAPYYAQPVVKTFNLFWTVTNIRAALILRILGPVIAAYGAVSVVRPLFWIVERFIKRLKKNRFWWYSTETVGAIVGFLIFWLIIKNVIILPPLGEDVSLGYPGYGPLVNWPALKRVDGKRMVRDEKTGQFTIPLVKDSKEIVNEIPGIFSMVGGGNGILTQQTEAIVKGTKVNSHERVDVSPVEGQIAASLGNSSQVSQIQAYFGSSLIQRMVGWQIYCVYYNRLCQSEDVKDLYNWFGVSQVWRDTATLDAARSDMKNRLDSFDFLEPEAITLDGPKEIGTYWNIYHVKSSTGLASITNKPVVLVIGDNPPNNDVYDIVFRVLPRIGWGYNNAWTVDGSRNIDDYSLEELSKYEAVILHGYRYKNSKRSWQRLEKYVENGGKLLVNTGWKYYAQDWGRDSKKEKGKYIEMEMPSIFPVEKTTWTNIGKSWPILSSDLNEENLEDWADLTWEGNEWSMAVAQKSWLKPGARAVLSSDDNVLMSEQDIGKGKILWTGFDFFGHLLVKRSANQEKFINYVIDNLMDDTSADEEKLNFDRTKPDLIKIKYNQLSGVNKLMFKEAVNNNWGAKLISKNKEQRLPIYKAGPGWKMIFLPEDINKGEVIFDYHLSRTEWVGIITSVGVIVFILFYGTLRLLRKDWDRNLLSGINSKIKKRIGKLKSDWKNDEQ